MQPSLSNFPRPQPPLWLCGAFLAAVFSVLLGWTWLGWPDPVVDFGRELYVPWQLAQGKVLYRDIAYFNGPLSPYFNALIFQCFGSSLRTLVIANLILLAGLTAMLFAFLSATFNRLAALIGCAAQLTIFSFIQLAGVGNYNFVTPYSHELTHGLFLSIAALLLLRKTFPPSPCTRGESGGERLDFSQWKLLPTKPIETAAAETNLKSETEKPSSHPSPRVQGEGGIYLNFSALLLSLVFLTKIEIFLALAGAMFVFLALSMLTQNAQGACFLGLLRPRRVIFLIISALIAPLLAFACFRCTMPAHDALHAVLGSWNYAFNPALSGNLFYKNLLGTADLSAHLLHIAAMFVLDAVVLLVLILFARFARGPGRTASVIVAWLLAVAAYFLIDPQWWQNAFAALPLGLIVILFIQGRAAWRGDSAARGRAAFTIFALLLLAKIGLNVRFSQYGFALAMPALLAAIVFCFADLPACLERRCGEGRVLPQLALPLIVLIIAVHLRPFAQLFAAKPFAVGSGADRFFARDFRTFPPDPRGLAVNRCLDQLRALPPNATVAIVPEGAMIPYLAKRVNPTQFINLMPPELLMFGESNILADFQAHSPDYIVLNDGSNPAEYGFRSFADYAPNLNAWIAAHYESTNNATIPAYRLRLLAWKNASLSLYSGRGLGRGSSNEQ